MIHGKRDGIMNSFIVLKEDERFIVKMYIDDQMKHMFEKHEEGPICNGSFLCSLLNVFMYHNEKLNNLWFMFDFDYNENELRVYTKDEDAFVILIREILVKFNDIQCVESFVECMILQKRYYDNYRAVD